MSTPPPIITKEQFEAQYATGSNVTLEWLRAEGHSAYPCACDYAGCEGWQMSREEWIVDEATMRGMSLVEYIAWLEKARDAARQR